MGRPPWTMGSPPCGTPNGICVSIDGIEILIAIALILALFKLLKDV